MNRADEDEELRRIREERMHELMRGGGREDGSGRTEAAPERPVTVTDGTLMMTVKKYPLVVIDCWAPWCGPCMMVAPVIEELARDYAGRIVFGKLNVDENTDTAERFRVMSIPTLLIFRNGKLVGRGVGAMPRRMLESIISKHLG